MSKSGGVFQIDDVTRTMSKGGGVRLVFHPSKFRPPPPPGWLATGLGLECIHSFHEISNQGYFLSNFQAGAFEILDLF